MGMQLYQDHVFNGEETKDWIFTVDSNVTVPIGQSLCVTGDCPSLGNWHPNLMLKLKQLDSSNIWTASVKIAANRDVKYRYAKCSILTVLQDEKNILKVAVHQIENNITPRLIKANDEQNVSLIDDTFAEMFGYIDGTCKVEQGPLISDSAIQLIMTSNAIQWKSSGVKEKEIYIKVCPIVLENGLTKEYLSHVIESESDLSATTLISVLNEGDNRYTMQKEYGHPLSQDDNIIFLTRTFYPYMTAFTFNFYINDQNDTVEKFKLIGYGNALLNTDSSTGELIIPVNTVDHKYLGQITVKYLLIHPLSELKHDLRSSYAKFWNNTWKGLEIGHRGAGVSFHDYSTFNADIRENTIGSMRNASEYGADMVEFDVQLSKDLIPAIYHDFHVLIPIANKTAKVSPCKLKLPLQEFSSDELQTLEIHHLKEKLSTKTFPHDGLDGYEPFPTLHKAFKEINQHVGFNVEIKYSLQQTNGTHELDYPIDMNRYVDTILNVVFHHAGSRYVVFSSFHPDICTMVRMKQNIYPVLFLTQGVTKKYVGYRDFRTVDIPNAVRFAISTDILGINVHTEELLRNPEQVDYICNRELVLFCWGDDNNNEEVIQLLKEKGVHGIIFDRFHSFTRKEERKSIFEKEQFALNHSIRCNCC